MTLSSTAVQTAIAQCTSRWAMARGHRLNTSIVLAAVTVSPVFFRRFLRSSLSLSRPLPTLSPSLIGHLASVDVKQDESKHRAFTLSSPSHSVPVPYKPSRLRGRKATIKQGSVPFPQCPCRSRLFACCCGRCSCVHLRGEAVSSYFSMACYSILLM